MNDTTIPLIGLDIGKNVNAFGAYASNDLDQAMIEPIEVHNNREGFAIFSAHLDELLAAYPVVKLGCEPTSVYYEAWAHEILRRYADEIAAGRLIFHIISPSLVKESRAALNKARKRKTDFIDTKAIARCLLLNEGAPAQLPDQDELHFNLWATRYRQLQKDSFRLVQRIRVQIDRLWPGALVNLKRFERAHPHMELPTPLIETNPFKRKRFRAILSHYPNPHDLLTFTEKEMIAFLREHIGSGGPKTARHVLQVAHAAILPDPESAALYAKYLALDWQHYLVIEAQLAELEAEVEVLVSPSPAAVLVSVPGIGPVQAAGYLAYVQDPHRFESADHIWAFAGFDPILNQSGDAKRVGKISKRGDPGFRYTLYMIGFHTAQHCPPISRAYKRARRRFRSDQAPTRATIHAAHAANRLLYRMLIEQAPYDPTRHS